MSELTDVQREIDLRRQILALEDLRSGVIATFAESAVECDQPFGAREKARQLGDRHRIVWVPGDENGNIGEVTAARNPGRNPRPLLTLNELFHVQITGWDAGATDDEFRQWHATRLLVDAWLRAVYLVAEGTFRILGSRWITTRSESRFGLSAVVTGAIASMVPDESQPELPANTVTADLALEVLDLDEQQLIPEPEPPP